MASDAAGFDEWHGKIARSARCGQLFGQALGLPAEVDSNSLLPGAGIAEVVEALALSPGQVLADLACGRGGYGMAVARATGASVIGLDFSAVALGAAAASVPRFGLAGRARFCLGSFATVGLRDRSVNGVMYIDAIQFGEPPVAALRECRRILAGGGRIAVTAWEPLDPEDERLPERIRQVNLARDLAAVGFERIEVTGKPDWSEMEHALWQAAMETDAAGDPAIETLQGEAKSVLETFDLRRRVLAIATAPA
jgi:SAM-dependent methyltransferase